MAALGQAPLGIFSPSKINLFLRVMRKREDGYHDLASLFHVIDLGDQMSFTLLPASATADSLTCSDPTIPTDASNLVIKALELLRRKTGIRKYFAVALNKRVPHGAGLGGGSGNAATTLFAANQLLGSPASNAQLLEWSGEIGSDISVFFSRGPAYCTGRGEVVEEVAPPVPLSTPMLLVKPPAGLPTPLIFKTLALPVGQGPKGSTANPRALLAGLAAQRTVSQALAVNDLEPPAFTIMPDLLELKKQLQASSLYTSVFMTGSGSTLVCFGSDKRAPLLEQRKDLFVSPARLIVRQDEREWFRHSGQWKA